MRLRGEVLSMSTTRLKASAEVKVKERDEGDLHQGLLLHRRHTFCSRLFFGPLATLPGLSSHRPMKLSAGISSLAFSWLGTCHEDRNALCRIARAIIFHRPLISEVYYTQIPIMKNV